MPPTFGEFIKEKRLEKNLTLRKFYTKLNYDTVNWSEIERGLLPAPDDHELLERICSF